MDELSVYTNDERRKKSLTLFNTWLRICTMASWFFITLCVVSRGRSSIARSYSLDFHNKRSYIRRLVYHGDSSCINLLRMNQQGVAASTSRTQSQYREKNNEGSSKRKRQKASEDDGVTSECILSAATMLGNDIKEASKILGATEPVIQEKVVELDKFLSEIEGLSTKSGLLLL